jgi:cobalt-zinc-cadmium efflux system protein
MHHADEHPPHFAARSPESKRRLGIALALAAGYMLAEIIGGLLTNSLALLADAGHMLSDVAALGLSLFALWMAERPPTARRTYGYYRMEILAALVNGAALVAVAIFVFLEACQRLVHPPEVKGAAMTAIAAGGLGVNLLSLLALSGVRDASLNLRGAWLHVLGDSLGSVGAIVAGALIWGFGWRWADPAVSAAIGALIVYSSWRLLSESVAVLMESAPRGLDVDAVRDAIRGVPGVASVHDLHVWTITSGMDSLSAHVVAADERTASPLLLEVRALLASRFGIHHVTIQIEPHDFAQHAACGSGPCDR